MTSKHMAVILLLGALMVLGVISSENAADIVTRSRSARASVASSRYSATHSARRRASTPPRFGLARLLEGDVPTPKQPTGTRDIFASELRHAVWAPRMEKAVAGVVARFDTTNFMGFKMTSIECRETTCLLEVEYPNRLRIKGLEYGPRPCSPAAVAFMKVGPFSSVSGDVGSYHQLFDRAGVLMEREAYIIQFIDPDEINPATYESWVERQHREIAARIAAGKTPFDKWPLPAQFAEHPGVAP